MAKMPTIEEWLDLVDEHLGFLGDRGYRLESVHDSPDLAAWGPRVRYLSSTTGLQLHWSREFVCVDTYVIRLVEGRVPDYPIFIHDGDAINWFHLGFLVGAVAPERVKDVTSLSGLTSDKVRRQLEQVAELLLNFPELLDAESPAFGTVTARIHDDVRENPPQITVYLPDDASPEEAAHAAEESRSGFPDVAVVVRRYFRRRRRRS